MVVNGFWDSKKLYSLPCHHWLWLGSKYQHHSHHQMVWVGKDFKGSISFSERPWQFVVTSCPRPAQMEPRCDHVAPPSPLTSVSPVLWTMEMKLIPCDGKMAFLEGVCPSSLPLLPCPTFHHSNTAACRALCILGMLLQHVCFQTWINV